LKSYSTWRMLFFVTSVLRFRDLLSIDYKYPIFEQNQTKEQRFRLCSSILIKFLNLFHGIGSSTSSQQHLRPLV
jgi:hypothetical protein